MDSTTFEQVLKDSPKSLKALREHIIQGLVAFQQQVSPAGENVELPDVNQFVTEEVVMNLLQSNIRILYDFFDKNEVYVFIDRRPESGKWCFSIEYKKENMGGFISDLFPDRFATEVGAFTSALKKLETVL